MLLSSFALLSQDIPVRGKIVDDQGEALAKVQVTFTETQNGAIFTSKSNKKGEFMRVGMPFGQYKVKAELDGFMTYETIIEVRGVTHVQVDITLPKAQPDIVKDEHFQKGMEFFEAKNFSQATEEFRQSLKIYPDSIEINYNLAISLLQTGSFDEAIACLTKVESLKADMPGLYMALATAYEKKGDLSQSLVAYSRAAEQNPADPLPAYYSGAIHYKLNDMEKAMAAFDEAIKRDPKLAPVYYQAGVVASSLNRYAQAVQYFETFLTLSPDAPEAAAVKEMVTELKKIKN